MIGGGPRPPFRAYLRCPVDNVEADVIAVPGLTITGENPRWHLFAPPDFCHPEAPAYIECRRGRLGLVRLMWEFRRGPDGRMSMRPPRPLQQTDN